MIELTKTESIKLMATLGKETWFTYSAMRILSTDNVVDMNQVNLSEALGVTDRTIRNHIKNLSAVTIQGEPLIKAERGFDGNVYRLLELNLCNEFPLPSNNNSFNSFKEILANGKPAKPKKEKKVSNTDIIFNYFLESYENRYGEKYRVSNFAREKGQVRNLIRKYNGDIELLKAIIDVVMRLFDTKWKSQKFNRPTIGAVLSWIAAQAEPMAKANMEESAEFEDVEITAVDDEALLEEYVKKGWL